MHAKLLLAAAFVVGAAAVTGAAEPGAKPGGRPCGWSSARLRSTCSTLRRFG